MKRLKILLFAFLLLSISEMTTGQTPFKVGNLVVLRVGDGAAPLSNSYTHPVFLDEYTTTGSLVQSIAMPTTVSGANRIFTLNGKIDFSARTGALILSPNGQWLTAAGMNVKPDGITTVWTSSTDINGDQTPGGGPSTYRTIAVVGSNAVINTSTILAITPGVGSLPYSAVTSNGSDIWTCFDFNSGTSSGGLLYTTIGSSTSTSMVAAPTTIHRIVDISNGQLYVTSIQGRVRVVGSGLPVTGGQTVASIPGIPTLAGQVQFFFADINPAIPGNDVLYITHDASGLQKYSFNGTTWVVNGTVGGDADDYYGITGAVNGTSVTLYCTRKDGELVTLTDASGYNGAFTGTPAVLATAGANTRFGGVAFAPKPASVKVSAKAFLQGAYNTSLSRHKDVTTAWVNVLNANALTQPFNVAPFNYVGTEHVSAGFFTSTAGVNTDITDWVLLELRDATTPATIISRQAALIREDGQIVDVDGVSPVTMTATAGVADGNYYIVIKHRNHLAIRSANPIALNGATATLYDFTDDQNKAYQNPSVPGNAAMATKDLPGTETGKFLLWAGNANGDGFIRASGASNVSDYLTLLGPLCLQGDFSKILNSVYRKEDMNLDGVVRASAALNVNDYITLLSTGILGGNTSNIIAAH